MPSPRRRNAVGSSWIRFVTDSDVKVMQERITAALQALQLVVETCPDQVDATTAAQWNAEHVAVAAYLADPPSLWRAAAQMDAGEDLLRDLNAWRDRFSKLSCKDVPPAFSTPEQNPLQKTLEDALPIALILGAFWFFGRDKR